MSNAGGRPDMQHNTVYTFIFAALICVVCGIIVSSVRP